jgi:hypothetical protein
MITQREWRHLKKKGKQNLLVDSMKKSLWIVALIWFIQPLQAQESEPCASHTYIDVLDSLYPGFKAAADESYSRALRATNPNTLAKISPIDSIYIIPVVFHVLYNTASENLSEELILDQLKDLNACFNRQNEDTINTRPIFLPVAGNARIRFVLASEDPDGNPTNGIIRKFTTRTTFYLQSQIQTINSDFMKFDNTGGSNAWDTERYLNIWLCDLRSASSSNRLLGYAFPPVGAQNWDNSAYPSSRQGAVVDVQMIGKDNPQGGPRNVLTQEKTLVHEVGHFLGLRHTWGDGFASTGCFVDDGIDDTPLQRVRSRGCIALQNTCAGDAFPDQIENYMDYSSAECSNLFTKQQVAMMRYNLENLRPNLAQKEYVFPPKPDIAETTFFPVPFADKLSVFINDLDEEDNYHVLLHDLHGRVVFESDLESQYINELTITGIAQGVYYAVLSSEKEGLILERKIVKVGK